MLKDHYKSIPWECQPAPVSAADAANLQDHVLHLAPLVASLGMPALTTQVLKQQQHPCSMESGMDNDGQIVCTATARCSASLLL